MSDIESDVRAHAAACEPSPDELSRLARRVARTRARRRSPVILGVVLAAAALAAIVVGRPTGPRHLTPGTDWQTLTPEIAAQAGGTGTFADDVLQWDDGAVRLSVTPNRGVHLRVVTGEAVVDVVGTEFVVDRDPIGTRVSVDRGKVSVSCTGAPPVLVAAGGAQRCLRSAEAGLGMVLRLEASGAPVEEWLPVVVQARSHPEGSADARAALLRYEVDGLLALDRVDEAAELAVPWLAAPPADAPLATIAQALLARDGCPRALPYLEALHGLRDGVASVWLADCLTDPAARARVLDEMATWDLAPEVRQAVEVRR